MYIDPGFGSMLIQTLIASLAVGATMLGIFRAKVKSFFSKKKKTDVDDEGKNDE